MSDKLQYTHPCDKCKTNYEWISASGQLGLKNKKHTCYTCLIKEELIGRLNDLPSDEKRHEIISNFCCHCGSVDSWCQCWNDE